MGTTTLIETWIQAIALVFGLSTSVLGYSAVLARIVRRPRLSTAVILPSGLGIYLILVFGVGCLPGGFTRVPQLTLLAVGIFLLVWYRRHLEIFDLRNFQWSREDWIWFLFPVLYLFVRALGAGLPHQHSDPLYYHLAAPKLWAELGQIRLVSEHPSFAQATLWDGIYGVLQLWTGLKGAAAHVVAQLAAQWIHFFWGQVGSILLAYGLAKRLSSRTGALSLGLPSGPLFFFGVACPFDAGFRVARWSCQK